MRKKKTRLEIGYYCPRMDRHDFGMPSSFIDVQIKKCKLNPSKSENWKKVLSLVQCNRTTLNLSF